MSNLRKMALSHGNIATVHGNMGSQDVTDIPHWKLRKHSRFISNLLKTKKDGDIGDIIKAVGNSSPIYNNTLRTEHLVLLMAAQSVMKFNTLARYSIGTMYVLVSHQLLEAIPHIPGVRSRRVFLSYKGFQLLDHWNKKYKRFQSYYNAFVNEDIRDKAKEYSVIRIMEGVHKDIKEIAEINTELDRKITKREKTFQMQRTLQDSIRKKSQSLPYANASSGAYIHHSFVGSSTIQQQNMKTDQVTLTTLRDSLFSNIFGEK